MKEHEATQNKNRSIFKNLRRLLLVIVGVIAIAQELRAPTEQRTWHGKVADLVPYDFRVPTGERFRETYWNPDGPIFSGKVWGVGWAPNFGALKKMTGL